MRVVLGGIVGMNIWMIIDSCHRNIQNAHTDIIRDESPRLINARYKLIPDFPTPSHPLHAELFL